MRILVTGGAGFIGSHLVDRLVGEGFRVAIVDNLSTGRKENLNPKAAFYNLDILHPRLAAVFEKEKPRVVFHYAAQISVQRSIRDPKGDAKVNIVGSLNVLEQCRTHKVKKIIFASTGGAIYGKARIFPTQETHRANPFSPYGVTKLAVEHYLHQYHHAYSLPSLVLRLANVYGPRQNDKGEAGVVAIFCNKLLQKKPPIIYGDGSQTRDFIFVNDVVEANIAALSANQGGIFNIGNGKETTISELLAMLKKLTKTDLETLYQPAIPGELMRSCLDYHKAKKILGWQPQYALTQGLAKTVAFYRKTAKGNERTS
ncbi:MAG: NAD-dependent epimerase/dehydratase family protein [Candidatus Portnoybacteria bacterium]|nr:NAD-dependent epimerase/dehydratase family protein [Candidatus Portnoybacteria bacterium]